MSQFSFMCYFNYTYAVNVPNQMYKILYNIEAFWNYPFLVAFFTLFKTHSVAKFAFFYK